MLQFIPVAKLSPHPNNPRKNLGDLTELSDSIKQNGILQNLTVVPSVNLCYDKENESWVEDKSQGTQYRVIIGHRRLSAAKLAGLAEVPCIVADMTQADQVRTMLMENIQREDLSVYEQAKGFQMMLDLGDTVEELAQKSGFSTSTVRRRVKLMELDDKKLKKSQERGATLFDYMELDKLENVDNKNAILAKIGTPNFKDALEKAVAKEKLLAYVAKCIETISTFATHIPESNRETMSYVVKYGRYGMGDGVDVPEDANTTNYFYTLEAGGTAVSLYAERLASDVAELERENVERAEIEAQRRERKAEADGISKRHATMRKEFIAGLNKTCIKAHIGDIVSAMVFASVGPKAQFRARWVNNELLAYLLGTTYNTEDDQALVEECGKKAVESPEHALVALAYAMVENNEHSYFRERWCSAQQAYKLEHSENLSLDWGYKLLAALGYEMSDEEQAMQDGTHEIFQKEEIA